MIYPRINQSYVFLPRN